MEVGKKVRERKVEREEGERRREGGNRKYIER